MSALLSLAFAALRGAVPLVGGFFTGGASWVLGFLSAALGTEAGRAVIVAVGCFLGGWFLGWEHEHAVKERAVAAAIEQTTQSRDAEWSQKLDQANAQIESRVSMAVAAAQAVPAATPLSDDDLVRLCAKSASCRGQLAARRRVQSNPVSKVGSGRHEGDNNAIGTLLGR